MSLVEQLKDIKDKRLIELEEEKQKLIKHRQDLIQRELNYVDSYFEELKPKIIEKCLEGAKQGDKTVVIRMRTKFYPSSIDKLKKLVSSYLTSEGLITFDFSEEIEYDYDHEMRSTKDILYYYPVVTINI